MAATTPNSSSSSSWFRFRYEEDKETTNETRNALLVVATLTATVTFSAGVNPPGGVWQEDKDGHRAGRAIYASQKPAFYVFLISNTIALSASILVLISLTYRFPFHVELWVALLSMFITYASAVFAVAPDETVRFSYVLAAAAGPFVFRFLIQLFRKLRNKR